MAIVATARRIASSTAYLCVAALGLTVRFCRCGRPVSRAARADCRLRLHAAGPGSADPSDGGPCSDGTGNLGHLVHHFEQMSELIGGGIGADLDRIVNAGGLPGCRVEPTRYGHADPLQPDAQRCGFPVQVIEDAAG